VPFDFVRFSIRASGKKHTMLIAAQLWVSLRYPSFVLALAVGIEGTFFVLVASAAKIGVLLPWEMPINILATQRWHATTPAVRPLPIVTARLGSETERDKIDCPPSGEAVTS
jgi:hypothetical protein